MKIYSYIFAFIAISPWLFYTYESIHRFAVYYQFGHGSREYTTKHLILVTILPMIVTTITAYCYYRLHKRRTYGAIISLSLVVFMLFVLWLLYFAGGLPVSSTTMVY